MDAYNNNMPMTKGQGQEKHHYYNRDRIQLEQAEYDKLMYASYKCSTRRVFK